jgi:hypothetical protein
MKILLGLSMAMLSLVSIADDVVPVDKVKDSINVRQQPDTTSEVVGRLKQGASLPLVTALDGWYEVQLEGDTTGFVSADWARVVVDSENESPDVMPDAAVEATAAIDSEAAEAAVVAVAETVEDVVDVEAVSELEGVIEEAAEVVDAHGVADETAVVDVNDAPAEQADEVVEPSVADEVPVVVEAAPVSGPPGPPGPPGDANIKGTPNFLVKFRKEAEGGNSQIFDDGNQVGIGTTEPKQRLEVNGSIQIHEQNSSVAGLMITQSSGETGYIMHNRASTLTIGAGSQDRITIDRQGNVGIGVSRPEHPLQTASGAHVTSGGVWTNSSSREKKENITALSTEQAVAALSGLEPVQFNYRNERDEDYVGFIAEDVPDLVANRDRQTLSTMDVVAVLTKVVQAQQRKIEELETRLDEAVQ